MKLIFCRDLYNIINKHPESWNLPCKLPRDADCGFYINPKDVIKIDNSLKVIEWIDDNSLKWIHFNEVFIAKPTNVLGEKYVNNMEKIE